jgi:heme/copper-type cytochrome/quinol oxidase subunit 1
MDAAGSVWNDPGGAAAAERRADHAVVDRYLGGHFFDTQAGGSAVLWQHFFWLFGHPEVYILVLPGFACASEILPVFSRKPIFGRAAMIGATITIAFVGLGVWAHHMFTVGMSARANIFFVASTMLIAVPTGIKVFNWLATMYGGQIRMDTAHAVLRGIPVPVPDRRSDRNHAGRGALSIGSSATLISSSRTSTMCC